MKRICCLILCVLLICTAGCGTPPASSDTPTSSTSTSTSTSTTASATTALPTSTTTSTPSTSPSTQTATLSLPSKFYFSSGVGAWSTTLELAKDLSFTGLFVDSNMGENGEGYPDGTRYICHFSGQFSQPTKVNETTWTMTLETIRLERTPGEEELADNVKYIWWEPYGLEDAKEVTIYLPGTKKADVPEKFVSWSLDYWDKNDTLTAYGLYNVQAQTGFTGTME